MKGLSLWFTLVVLFVPPSLPSVRAKRTKRLFPIRNESANDNNTTTPVNKTYDDYLFLPQYDPNFEKRYDEVETSKKAFKNVIREWTVKKKTYYLNYGPEMVEGGRAMIMADEVTKAGYLQGNPHLRLIAGRSGTFRTKTVEDYTALYENLDDCCLPIPYAHDIDDESFGEERLTIKGHHRLTKVREGNYGTLEAVKENISDGKVSTICGKNVTNIDVLVSNNRLYKEDVSFSSEYNDEERPEKYAPSVIGYFCVTDDEKFMPLAIHILDNDLVYNPFDEESDWLLAKSALNAAVLNTQEMDHFVYSHLILEPIRVAFLQSISESHPIYHLMEHHLRGMFSNTLGGLVLLLGNKTPFDLVFGWGAPGALRFLEKELTNAPMITLGERLTQQGLWDIPNFKFRDDCLVMWDAFDTFFTDYLGLYYIEPTDILFDHEVQNWAAEACIYQFDFPCAFETVDELKEIMVNMVFRATIKHHSWNSDVTWHISAYPFSLPSLNHPLPTSKGTSIDFMDYVIPRKLQSFGVGLFAEFYRPMNDPFTTLLDSYKKVNLGQLSGPIVEKHFLNMQKIDANIDDRERGNKKPYLFLKPSRLPHYVWI